MKEKAKQQCANEIKTYWGLLNEESKKATHVLILCFPGTNQWHHGPVQRIWVVSIECVHLCLCSCMTFLGLNKCEHVSNVSLQQHGRLWEDWDIGGQRQSGDREHQTGVLWAAAGSGERWLWKGNGGAQEAASRENRFSSNSSFNKHIIYFPLCAGFSSSESCWRRFWQNICHESSKKGT